MTRSLLQPSFDRFGCYVLPDVLVNVGLLPTDERIGLVVPKCIIEWDARHDRIDVTVREDVSSHLRWSNDRGRLRLKLNRGR